MEKPQQEKHDNSTPTAQEQQEFLALWERMTEQQKSAIKKFMEAMLKK